MIRIRVCSLHSLCLCYHNYHNNPNNNNTNICIYMYVDMVLYNSTVSNINVKQEVEDYWYEMYIHTYIMHMHLQFKYFIKIDSKRHIDVLYGQ